MKYTTFELLAMGVGVAAVLATSFVLVEDTILISEVIGQVLILVALFGGLHYGRTGAVAGFLIAAVIYGVAVFTSQGSEIGNAVYLFVFRSVVYGAIAFAAGELNVRLKYLFVKLEHHDFVDDITSLYNSRYLSRLISKHISEFDRYGSKFSLASLMVDDELLVQMKKKNRVKVIKDIGNSVIRTNIRGSDEAARVEGSTFTILFPNTNHDGATIACIRVKGKVAGYLERHGHDSDKEDTVLTEVLEYPKNKDLVESLADRLADDLDTESY